MNVNVKIFKFNFFFIFPVFTDTTHAKYSRTDYAEQNENVKKKSLRGGKANHHANENAKYILIHLMVWMLMLLNVWNSAE